MWVEISRLKKRRRNWVFKRSDRANGKELNQQRSHGGLQRTRSVNFLTIECDKLKITTARFIKVVITFHEISIRLQMTDVRSEAQCTELHFDINIATLNRSFVRLLVYACEKFILSRLPQARLI